MAKHSSALCIVALATGCGAPAPPKPDETVQMITENEQYRKVVKEDYEEDWTGLSPEAAFAKADALGLHPGYVAYLELYPDSEQAATARERINAFRGIQANEGPLVISPEQQKEMCWSARGRMFRWSRKAGGGFGPDGTTFGSIVFGSEGGDIQMVQGRYRTVSGGIELAPGTVLIYPGECKPALYGADVSIEPAG